MARHRGKRAAFLRRHAREHEFPPLFADVIGAMQHGVDEEMTRRAEWWGKVERAHRAHRFAAWREACAQLFTPMSLFRRRTAPYWRTRPYPGDPSYFAGLLRQIEAGGHDRHRPLWIVYVRIEAPTTRQDHMRSRSADPEPIIESIGG